MSVSENGNENKNDDAIQHSRFETQKRKISVGVFADAGNVD